MQDIKIILSKLDSAPSNYIIKFSFQNFLRPLNFRPHLYGGRNFDRPESLSYETDTKNKSIFENLTHWAFM